MEGGLHLVDGEQRGSVAGRRSEIAHIVDDRTLHAAVAVEAGALHLLHPCALALAGAGEEVGHEDGDMLAGLGVDHVVDGHLVHVSFRVGHLHHLYAVEALGGQEEPLQHVVE